jgi:hypothetical protein
VNVTATASPTVNIFMVYSPLHCLCADQVARHFCQGDRNLLFYLKQGYADSVDHALWETVHYLPWPRFNPSPGLLGRHRRTLNNLNHVADLCKGAAIIRLHATVIDTEAVNYHINFLRRRFPKAQFNVRLFPDGVLNLRRHPLGRLKEYLQYFRMGRMLLSPSLCYHCLKGDRTGSDDPLVDRIYILPGLSHDYEPAKVLVLPPFQKAHKTDNCQRTDGTALVVGQPLVVYRRMTDDNMRAVSLGIKQYLLSQGIKRVVYKPHPRDRQHEYALEEYELLQIDKPLEQHFAETSYPIVISVCSTALLTARMILPPECRVIAYGLDCFIFRGEKDRSSLLGAFTSMGVEMVAHESHSAYV